MHDQVVFITGASSGFGEATARAFAAKGARLVLAARRSERLRHLAAQLSVPVLWLGLDVCDSAAVKSTLESLPEGFREVSILVNNAGLALGLEPAQTASLDDWDCMLDTNCRGLVHVTRALLPGMVERGRGHVVNLGSVAGNWPYPGGNVYGATKAFVRQFSLNLRADLHGTGVRVTNLEPGAAETEFSVVRFHGDQSQADAVYQGLTPLSAQDIAEAILYVTSLPAHVNVNSLELMCTAQSFGPFPMARRPTEPEAK